MLNHRLSAFLVLLACVLLPMAIHWLISPGINWVRPYILWGLFIIATWLWQRRRRVI
ncbi:MAG: hypothetical protein AB7U63_17500 [Porticoccaceae bacterium]|jgi:hypothetical protein